MLKKLKSVADKMAKHAHNIGSCDNITVTILLLLRSPSSEPPGVDYLSDGEDEYPIPVSSALHSGERPAWSSPADPPIGLTLDPRRVGSTAPLSPGTLSSEILSAMDGSGTTAKATGRTKALEKSEKASFGENKGTSASDDQDEDLMSFLLDDSNF